MRSSVFIVLLAGTACQPTNDLLCRACEPGGCPEGLRCAASAAGAQVCVPEQGTVAACMLIEPSALDAGAAEDSGVQRACPAPPAAGLTWVYSPYAELCFTQTEVTAEQFNACVSSGCTAEANYQAFRPPDDVCTIGSLSYSAYPANCILDPVGAEDFCTYVGGRLPTEDEWYAEASARGARTYPWGEERATCEYAVMNEGSGGGCNEGIGIAQVPCQHPAGNSASGLCDMAGNVWELTSTIDGPSQIMRGGDYASLAAGVRAASRRPYETGALDYIGFRCVTAPLP